MIIFLLNKCKVSFSVFIDTILELLLWLNLGKSFSEISKYFISNRSKKNELFKYLYFDGISPNILWSLEKPLIELYLKKPLKGAKLYFVKSGNPKNPSFLKFLFIFLYICGLK